MNWISEMQVQIRILKRQQFALLEQLERDWLMKSCDTLRHAVELMTAKQRGKIEALEMIVSDSAVTSISDGYQLFEMIVNERPVIGAIVNERILDNDKGQPRLWHAAKDAAAGAAAAANIPMNELEYLMFNANITKRKSRKAIDEFVQMHRQRRADTLSNIEYTPTLEDSMLWSIESDQYHFVIDAANLDIEDEEIVNAIESEYEYLLEAHRSQVAARDAADDVLASLDPEQSFQCQDESSELANIDYRQKN